MSTFSGRHLLADQPTCNDGTGTIDYHLAESRKLLHPRKRAIPFKYQRPLIDGSHIQKSIFFVVNISILIYGKRTDNKKIDL